MTESNSSSSLLPTFSVVVPVRNMQATILRTLDSIFSQVGVEVQVIVIDGASTDGTLDKIELYRDRLSVVVSEPDSGVYHAINKGLQKVEGDFVAILNGDDYYSGPSVLFSYVEKFADPAIGIVFGDLEFFLPGSPSKTIRSYSSERFHPRKLKYGWMPPHPTMIVRRQVYDLVGPYSADYEISSDFEFVVRALWKHKVAYARVPSIVVRMQYGGLSTKGIKATYILNNEIIRACKSNGLHTSWLFILLKLPGKLLEFLPRKPANGLAV